MNHVTALYHALEKEEKLHHDDIYNYAIPNAWNMYGYPDKKNLRSREILVNPYRFYLFTLRHILMDEQGKVKKSIPFQDAKASKGSWLKKSSIYSLMVRTATAWDHDRDDALPHDNLYHLSDNGTFLKSILLIPYLKRMGINTILMHQPFALSKTQTPHTYAAKECVRSFTDIDETLHDPLVPELNVLEQCLAFIEACHMHGIRVLLEFCPGKLARDNTYYQKHPEWFYWMTNDELRNYHAPICNALPQNTIPHTYALKDFYRSEDVKAHLAFFRNAPKPTDMDLAAIEKLEHITIAPMFSDQINAHLPIDEDGTVFRFFEDFHIHVPKNALPANCAPYLMQDSIRYDLHPGKKALRSLWDMLNETIQWYQQTLGVDGIYLEKTYLLPEKLQKELVKTARKGNRHFAMIAEDTLMENSSAWVAKGFDAISGNSGYEETNIWDFRFHTFAYRLKGNACPMFAASEFYDARRVCSLENGRKLMIMLSVMNQFLPNGIPMLMNGVECYEVQPMQLSEYRDKKYLSSLPKEDLRYRQQAYLDAYYFNYRTPDLNVLPSLLERCCAIRNTYLDAISKEESCIPVWFDSPKDFGIGYSFVLEDRALMVICNTNINTASHLHIHTENLYSELPFTVAEIHQIFSTSDPYIHDVPQDSFRNLPLDFECGEVKFIEFKATKSTDGQIV